MSENPYDPPTANDPGASPITPPVAMQGKYSKMLLAASVVFAAIAGAIYFSMIVWPSDISEVVVGFLFGIPALSLVLMSFNCALYRNGWRVTIAEFGRVLRIGGVMILFASAGYVAFVATCCCTNAMAVGPNYSPPALFGGIVTFLSTLLGCLAIAGLFRLLRPNT